MVDTRTLERVSTKPAAPAGRRERKEQTRRALLDAALTLLADRPLRALSLREVAKRAGIVPTAFYRHFASMDELGVTLVDESMRTLRTMIRTARMDEESSADAIRASVRLLYRHVREHEAHFRFLARERHGGSGEVHRAIGMELRLFASELAVDFGRFDFLRDWSSEDLHMIADLVVSTMFTTAVELLEVRSRDPEADEQIIKVAEKQLRLIILGVPAWRSRR